MTSCQSVRTRQIRFLSVLVRVAKPPFPVFRTESCPIGQRYHVVVEAKPVNISHGAPPENFWIRTVPATGCSTFNTTRPPANTTGILRYNADNHATPTTVNGSYSLACSDEPYDKLKPILPWTIGKSSNERMSPQSPYSPSIIQRLTPNNRAE